MSVSWDSEVPTRGQKTTGATIHAGVLQARAHSSTRNTTANQKHLALKNPPRITLRYPQVQVGARAKIVLLSLYSGATVGAAPWCGVALFTRDHASLSLRLPVRFPCRRTLRVRQTRNFYMPISSTVRASAIVLSFFIVLFNNSHAISADWCITLRRSSGHSVRDAGTTSPY